MAGKKKNIDVKLPNRIVSRHDVLMAARELESLRDELIAQNVKQTVATELPRMSERARSLLEVNEVYDITEESLNRMKKKLEHIVDRVPVLRFTFAGEPDGKMLTRIIDWLRTEIDSSVLMIYSVQPQIAGGFILTTDRKRYDLSWRAELQRQPFKLGEALRNAK